MARRKRRRSNYSGTSQASPPRNYQQVQTSPSDHYRSQRQRLVHQEMTRYERETLKRILTGLSQAVKNPSKPLRKVAPQIYSSSQLSSSRRRANKQERGALHTAPALHINAHTARALLKYNQEAMENIKKHRHCQKRKSQRRFIMASGRGGTKVRPPQYSLISKIKC